MQYASSPPGSVRTLLLVLKPNSILNRDHLCYLVPIDSILVWLFIHATTSLVSFPNLKTVWFRDYPDPAGRPLKREARAQSKSMRCALNRNTSYGVCIRQIRSVLLAPLGGVRAAAAATGTGATLQRQRGGPEVHKRILSECKYMYYYCTNLSFL